MIYPNFEQFYEEVVAPRKRANPDHHRLDGWDTCGNFEVAGTFRHGGRCWKVHADSRYEPLQLAYDELTGAGADPFVSAATKNGDRLDLREELQRRRGSRYKHLYIYSAE